MDSIFIVVLVIVLITFAFVYLIYKMNTKKEGRNEVTKSINPVISKIYTTHKVELLDGTLIPLRANVHDQEGLLIYTLIKKHK